MVPVLADLAGIVRPRASGVALDFGKGFPAGALGKRESQVFALGLPLLPLGVHVTDREPHLGKDVRDGSDEIVAVSPKGAADPRVGSLARSREFIP